MSDNGYLDVLEEGKCVWKYTGEPEYAWLTECGHMHIFNEGDPVANEYIGCPYCMLRIKEVPDPDDMIIGE